MTTTVIDLTEHVTCPWCFEDSTLRHTYCPGAPDYATGEIDLREAL